MRIVDFGANGVWDGGGDDVSTDVSCGTITQNAWSEMELDVSALATIEHIAQILFIADGVPDNQTFYLDNIYFH